MVEYTYDLDSVFKCLADGTRRDILERLRTARLTVSQIAADYDMSLAAVSKHLKVLEQAKLIVKKRKGKEQHVAMAPYALKNADEYLEQYRQTWQSRYDKLDKLINEEG